MFKFLFNIFYPENESKLPRYIWELKQIRHQKLIEKNIKTFSDIPSKYFDVKGAGRIQISKSCHHMCGHSVGFSFGVEWSDNPFIGGVIGRKEARELAEFILKQCDSISETEEEEEERFWRELRH